MIWLSSHCLCISHTAWSDYHHTVRAFLVLHDLIIITLSVYFSYCMIWLPSHCLCISLTAWSDYHHTVCAFLILYDLIIITLSVHFSYCMIWLSSHCLCISLTAWSDYHHTVCAFLVLHDLIIITLSVHFSYCMIWLSSHCLCISHTVWSDYHHTVHFSYCMIWLSSHRLCISHTVWSDYHHTVCAFLVISSTIRLFHSQRFSFQLLMDLSCFEVFWSAIVTVKQLYTLRLALPNCFYCLQHVLARLGHYEIVQYKASLYIYINGEHHKSRCQSVELMHKISMYC